MRQNDKIMKKSINRGIKMDNLTYDLSLKNEMDDFQVEFDCLSNLSSFIDDKRQYIDSQINNLDGKIEVLQKKIDECNAEIERLTYHGDTGDLILAVSSGVIAAVIDMVFVGECGLFKEASETAKDKFQNDLGRTHESLNRYIMKYARKNGYTGEEDLSKAISFLEKKFPVAQDNVWKCKKISSSKTHHLDDLAHHPTFLGLIAAIAVQYFGVAVFANRDGKVNFVFKPTKKELINIVILVVFTGLINWLVNIAENKMLECDKEIPKPIRKLIKNLRKAPIALAILKTFRNWKGHLISDMGGSKNTAGKGQGIPGFFLSFLKELSMLPILKDSKLPKILNDLYLHNKDSSLTNKLDLRAELTVCKSQCIPVIVNEMVVRTVYFVRHLIIESQGKKARDIEWSRVIPFYNRTIARMMTVATGTFTAIDLMDAAVETSIKNPNTCMSPYVFLGKMLVRVNFVGIGRFAIAVTTDVGMGIKKVRTENERSVLIQNLILSGQAKMYYRLADSQLAMVELYDTSIKVYDNEIAMWKQVEQTQKSIDELYCTIYYIGKFYAKSFEKMNTSLDKIEDSVTTIRENDPKFINELLQHLK